MAPCVNAAIWRNIMEGKAYHNVEEVIISKDNLPPNRRNFEDSEIELYFAFNDGFALEVNADGELVRDNALVLLYPKLTELTNDMKDEIISYVGRAAAETGINYHDVALTFGKVNLLEGLIKTTCYCPHCGNELEKSTVERYSWQCLNCDEDFYNFEVLTSKPT